jgi:hypothetical protein
MIEYEPRRFPSIQIDQIVGLENKKQLQVLLLLVSTSRLTILRSSLTGDATGAGKLCISTVHAKSLSW